MKPADEDQANQIAEYYLSRARKEMTGLVRRPARDAEEVSAALESSFIFAAAATTLSFDTLSDVEKSFPIVEGEEESARYILLTVCADFCFESCRSSIYQLALGLHGGSMATARAAIEGAVVFCYLKKNWDDLQLFDRFVRYGMVQVEAQSSSLLKHTDFTAIDKQRFAEEKHAEYKKLTAEMTKKHKLNYGWVAAGLDDKGRIGFENLAEATEFSYLMPSFKIFNSAAHGLPEYLLRARKLWHQTPIDAATTVLYPVLEAQHRVAYELDRFGIELGDELNTKKVQAIKILSQSSREVLALLSQSLSRDSQ